MWEAYTSSKDKTDNGSDSDEEQDHWWILHFGCELTLKLDRLVEFPEEGTVINSKYWQNEALELKD